MKPFGGSRQHVRFSILCTLSALLIFPPVSCRLVLPPKVPSHPRLILQPRQDLTRIHQNIETYPLAAELYQGLVQHAELLILHAKESVTDVRNLRDVSYTLGLMWQLTRNTSYARAATDVLVSASRINDFCST